MVELTLDVRCDLPGTTMNVTSNHLQLRPIHDQYGTTANSEELNKRSLDFGMPVSKSERPFVITSQ